MVRPHSVDIVNQYVVTKDRMAPRSGVVTSMGGHYIGIQHSVNQWTKVVHLTVRMLVG